MQFWRLCLLYRICTEREDGRDGMMGMVGIVNMGVGVL